MANEINITDLSVKAAAALTTADYLVTFTDDGNTTKTPVFETISQANTENGCLCVKTAKLVIPSAEVLQLNTTPKPFGLTVPSGYVAQVITSWGSMVFNSIAYASEDFLAIRAVGADRPQTYAEANGVLGGTSNSTFVIPQKIGRSDENQFVIGADLEVYCPTTDPTAGDSDITIYLTYVLIEL